MNRNIIIWFFSLSLLFVAVLMAVSGVIAFCTPGDDSRLPLLSSALLTGIVGSFPLI